MKCRTIIEYTDGVENIPIGTELEIMKYDLRNNNHEIIWCKSETYNSNAYFPVSLNFINYFCKDL